MQHNFRKELQPLLNQEKTFYGKFSKYGQRKKGGKIITTVLIKDIRVKDGGMVSDHLWLDMTPELQAEDLKHATIKIKGVVSSYLKGYLGNSKKPDHRYRNCNLGIDYEIVPRVVYVCKKQK